MKRETRLYEVKGLVELLEKFFEAYEDNPNPIGNFPVTGIKSTLASCREILMEELGNNERVTEDLSECADILKKNLRSPLSGRIRKVPLEKSVNENSVKEHY